MNNQNNVLESQSDCSIKTVMSAAFMAYGIHIENDQDKNYGQKIQELKNSGYEKIHSCSQSKSTFLTAVCYAQETPPGPVIIAYRGTDASSSKDLAADIHLSATGIINKKYREEAFEFYEKIKKEYPKREIILTGHSLGGHLAQYVGLRAYSNSEERKSKSIFVRTFNSATIKTKYGEILEKNSSLNQNFHNYRLQYDLVSTTAKKSFFGTLIDFLKPSEQHLESQSSRNLISISGNGCYGQMFTFKSKTRLSHNLSVFFDNFSNDIMAQNIGKSLSGTAEHNALIETIRCSFSAYEVQISKQLGSFWEFRKGAKNSKKMQAAQSKIFSALQESPLNYHKAMDLLLKLSQSVKGKNSTNLIKLLLKEIIIMQEIHKTHQLEMPIDNQKAIYPSPLLNLHNFQNISLANGAVQKSLQIVEDQKLIKDKTFKSNR